MLHSVCYFVIYSVNSIYEDKQIGGISPQTKRVFLKIKDDCYQKDFFLYLKSINDIVSVSTKKKLAPTNKTIIFNEQTIVFNKQTNRFSTKLFLILESIVFVSKLWLFDFVLRIKSFKLFYFAYKLQIVLFCSKTKKRSFF